MVKKLMRMFRGAGEVSNYDFEQVKESDNGYIYLVCDRKYGGVWFEVIRKIESADCVDFVGRVYSDTEFSERYPKSKSWGKNGYTCMSLVGAEKKLEWLKDH